MYSNKGVYLTKQLCLVANIIMPRKESLKNNIDMFSARPVFAYFIFVLTTCYRLTGEFLLSYNERE